MVNYPLFGGVTDSRELRKTSFTGFFTKQCTNLPLFLYVWQVSDNTRIPLQAKNRTPDAEQNKKVSTPVYT
jgi:hypothetical protein